MIGLAMLTGAQSISCLGAGVVAIKASAGSVRMNSPIPENTRHSRPTKKKQNTNKDLLLIRIYSRDETERGYVPS